MSTYVSSCAVQITCCRICLVAMIGEGKEVFFVQRRAQNSKIESCDRIFVQHRLRFYRHHIFLGRSKRFTEPPGIRAQWL